jgi:hypothetical protein
MEPIFPIIFFLPRRGVLQALLGTWARARGTAHLPFWKFIVTVYGQKRSCGCRSGEDKEGRSPAGTAKSVTMGSMGYMRA